jgi:uncharacterized cupredoxin-like copper-binding protein
MSHPGYSRVGLAASAMLCAVVLLSGCGSGGPTAEGTVTLDGQPVDGGTIVFVPSGNEGAEGKRPPASGEIKAGKYVVDSTHNLKTGQYRVEITWNKKTGKQIVNASDPPNKIDETRQVIPRKYNKESKTTVEVKPGSNKFDYPLTSK